MFQGFNYRPFLPSIAKNKVTPSDTAKSSRSRLLNARWTHVLSSTLKTCICLSINFFNFFLTYDPLPFRQLSELEFQLLSDFAKVKVWATEKVRSGSSKKLIKTRYYSLFDPFQLHITLVWTGILLSVWLYKPKAENYWAVRERKVRTGCPSSVIFYFMRQKKMLRALAETGPPISMS